MNIKHRFSYLLAASAFIAGCETMPFQTEEEPPVKLLNETETETETGGYTAPETPVAGLTLASQKRFNEIPLPEGLREDTQRSFVYDSRSTKIGKMVYYTKSSVNELAQFYITNAPGDGWSLISSTQSDDSVMLFFVKPGKRLNVESKRLGVGRNNELVLSYLPAEEPVQ